MCASTQQVTFVVCVDFLGLPTNHHVDQCCLMYYTSINKIIFQNRFCTYIDKVSTNSRAWYTWAKDGKLNYLHV